MVDKNETVKKPRGGKRPGAGRKPKVKHLTNYEAALKLLDDDVEDNIKFLIGLRNNKKNGIQTRLRASELLLNKTLPNKKEEETKVVLPFDVEFSNWSDEKLKAYVNGDKQ